MMSKFRLIPLILVIFLYTNFTCHPCLKYAVNQELFLKPDPIIVINEEINFQCTIRVPSELFKEIDSLKYRFTIEGNTNT